MTLQSGDLDRISKLREGDLSEVPFAVLLYALARAGRTASVHIKRGPLQKQIILENGVPVDCRSNLIHETLSRFIVSAGFLEQAAAEDAFRESVSKSVRFGDVLLDKGLVSAEQLIKILQQNLAHKLLDGFSWRDGTFRLTDKVPRIDTPLKVNVVQLVLIGVSRFATQEQIDASIGPLIGKALAVNPSPGIPVDDIKLPPGHKPLTDALRSKHMRIDELATATGIAYEDLTRSLYALALIELVIPADLAPAEPMNLTAADHPKPPQRKVAAPAKEGPEKTPPALSEADRDELHELVLNHRRRDAFDLLGVEPDKATTTAHLRFLEFAEKFAPWRFDGELAESAQDVFLAGARAYARLCDPDRRAALIKERKQSEQTSAKAATSDQFRVETDLLDSEKQFRQGIELARSGDLLKAMNQLEFAADLAPQNALYRSELAFCRYQINPDRNAKPALEMLGEALRQDPGCGLALYYSGEILRHAGRLDEAEVFLKRSLKPMAPDRRPVDALRAISQERKAAS